jgi:N-glycosylase/DNA lyase
MKRKEIRDHYENNREEIESRLEEFRNLRDAPEDRKFLELVFVILTSQTEAQNAWKAAKALKNKDSLLSGNPEDIDTVLERNEVRYAEEKAIYIVQNREELSQPTLRNPERQLKISEKIDQDELDSSRAWFAENVSGISWKGASHFLRNIGYGNGFAIVSSHIIGVMNELGLTESTEPPSGREKYLEVEERIQELAEELDIDVKALDLVLWSMRTGEVFK